MFVVIFRAEIDAIDEEYVAVASRMRDLALSEFGCIEFVSATEGTSEIALSYWPDEESIRAWKAHPEHVLAQRAGREKWYKSYSVQIAKIDREYASTT